MPEKASNSRFYYPVDTQARAADFLPKAVAFCNNKLHGTLAACISINERTKKSNTDCLDQAVTNLEYDGIAINTMAVLIVLNAYLTWGGNDQDYCAQTNEALLRSKGLA